VKRKQFQTWISTIGLWVGLSACCNSPISGTDLNDSGVGDCVAAGGTCIAGASVNCAGIILTADSCSTGLQSGGAICCILSALPDAGLDAGSDAGPDAGQDAGLDAGPDAGFDGGADAGPKPACPPVLDAGSCTPGRASNLASSVTYPAQPYASLLSADLNGDGLLDLLAIQEYAPASDAGFDVYFGQPDGGLSGPVFYAANEEAVAAIGDLNGDGRADVAITGGAGIEIFINDGSGGLVLEATLAAPIEVTSMGIGDLNGDGFSDLVVAERGIDDEHALIFFGESDGGFSAPVTISALEGMSSATQQVLVADLNEDGLADIVAASYPPLSNYPPELAVLLSQSDGGFQMTTYPVPFSAFALLPQPGKAPDVAVVNSAPGEVSDVQVLENTCAGSFLLGRAYGVGIAGFTVGDFNGDCIPDIATTLWFVCGPPVTIAVLYGDGKGGFGAPQALQPSEVGPSALAPLGPVGSPRALVASDFCGSGLTVYGDASR
jgi:hypothetical protein